jgi:hypothetical protein
MVQCLTSSVKERNRRENASNFGNPEWFAKEKRREVSLLYSPSSNVQLLMSKKKGIGVKTPQTLAIRNGLPKKKDAKYRFSTVHRLTSSV